VSCGSERPGVRLQRGFVADTGRRRHRRKTSGPHPGVAARRRVGPWTRPGARHARPTRARLFQRHRQRRHLPNAARRMASQRAHRPTAARRRLAVCSTHFIPPHFTSSQPGAVLTGLREPRPPSSQSHGTHWPRRLAGFTVVELTDIHKRGPCNSFNCLGHFKNKCVTRSI